MDKTNAMRILDQKKIPYLTHEYPHDGDLCVIGTDVARLLNQDPNKVFKTLVTTYNNHYYVLTFLYLVLYILFLQFDDYSSLVNNYSFLHCYREFYR